VKQLLFEEKTCSTCTPYHSTWLTCILTILLALLPPLPLYLDSLQPILSLDPFMFYLQDSKNNSQNACPTCTQVPNTWNIYLTLHDQLVLLVRK